MNVKQLIFASSIAFAISMMGCKKDDPETTNPTTPASGYTNGVFITNEGPYGTGTGTVSFYSRSNGSVSSDIFNTKNSFPLGNVVQSMEVYNSKGYIVVNNAGKVEVVDANSFASVGTITGLTSPRCFLGITSSKGYISQFGSGATGEVKVIDLNTNAITGTIATGNGADAMVKVGNTVYVACSGGFTNDTVVTAIDATTNAVLTNINTGANPASMQLDANGKLWVLCVGKWNSSYTSLVNTGSLVRINPATNTVELSLPFASTTNSPMHLCIDAAKTTLYYLYNGGVYVQPIAAPSLASAPLINRGFYSLGYDPTSNAIFAGDAGNFSSNGKVIRYNQAGVVLDSFAAGIIPGNFCFR